MYSSHLIPSVINLANGSHLWKALCRVWTTTLKGVKWAVANGQTTKFWTDIWIGDTPLLDVASKLVPAELLSKAVREYTNINGLWNWHGVNEFLPNSVLLSLTRCLTPHLNLGVLERLKFRGILH